MNAPPPPSDLDAGTQQGHMELLRLLESHPDFSQRQLAAAMGVSVGKTHYLLKALLKKGWVKAKNFQRSDHKLGYLYVLTPSGVNSRLQLTRSFLAHKEAEYEALRMQIKLLRDELTAQADAEGAQPQSRKSTGAHP